VFDRKFDGRFRGDGIASGSNSADNMRRVTIGRNFDVKVPVMGTFLLALAYKIIFGSVSRWTHDTISLSHDSRIHAILENSMFVI
jgi:hypothetical protein